MRARHSSNIVSNKQALLLNTGWDPVCAQDGQLEGPEDVYQATFDTLPGEWTTVYIPWQVSGPGSPRENLLVA